MAVMWRAMLAVLAVLVVSTRLSRAASLPCSCANNGQLPAVIGTLYDLCQNGEAGRLRYVSNHNVVQLCNGLRWLILVLKKAPAPPTTASPTTTPTPIVTTQPLPQESVDAVLGTPTRAREGLGDWDNVMEGDLNLDCPDHGAIVSVSGVHDNVPEDRMFRFMCSSLRDAYGRKPSTTCTWSGFTGYHRHVYYQCPANMYLSGWRSHYDGSMKDRQMSFQCCRGSGVNLDDCKATSYWNAYDTNLHYHTKHESGYLLTGTFSFYNTMFKDRLYGFMYCKASFPNAGVNAAP